jgi:hypothetical protein
MQRLTSSAVAPYRAQLLAKQVGKCALCKRDCRQRTPCLDHCHDSGVVRGVLCRGCNAQLGKIENNLARNGLTETVALTNFLTNIVAYLAFGKRGGYNILHPTHKTEDEKRLKRNADARKRRAATKKA